MRADGQQIAVGMGQPVIVDNRPGAATNIAVRALIENPPDGYTLLLAAKARPQTIAYASPGNGATPHLAVEQFQRAAGISLVHVPDKGGAPAITDVVGGHVQALAVNALETRPLVKAGKLRVLAVLSRKCSPLWPDVPTIAESGYVGFEASVWYGFVAPAATPKPVIARLHAEVQKALASSDVRERLSSAGEDVIPASTEQFAAMIEAERLRYEKLIREANIKPD